MNRTHLVTRPGLVLSLVVLLVLACVACGSVPGDGSSGGGAGGPGGGDPGFGAGWDGGPPPGCVNLQCRQHDRGTRVSGTVYDPKGTLPLYNVFVYVPNAPLDPITTGPVCTPCQAPASGKPLVAATTDENGHFIINDVPDGAHVPLVMQLGKWRRVIDMPFVKVAEDNHFNTKLDPHDKAHEQIMRLPRRQHEGSPDDNIPLMAVTTGAADYGECFIMNTIGIDPQEFDKGGRVQIYDGVGGETARPYAYGPSSTLFNDAPTLDQYDLVFMSCEGATHDRGQSGYQNVEDYVNSGGRFFSTHFAYNFFANEAQCARSGDDPTCRGPADFNGVANWAGNDGSVHYSPPYVIDQSFPKGKAFATWIQNVQPGGTPGELDLRDTRGDVDMVAGDKATRWIYTTDPGDGNPNSDYSTLYLSFNTPVNAPEDQQCGRAVFSDVHVAGTPSGFCADQDPDYQPNLNALEFLFFDLSSCVQSEKKAPIQPPH